MTTTPRRRQRKWVAGPVGILPGGSDPTWYQLWYGPKGKQEWRPIPFIRPDDWVKNRFPKEDAP